MNEDDDFVLPELTMSRGLHQHMGDTLSKLQDLAQRRIEGMRTNDLDELAREVSESRTNPAVPIGTSALDDVIGLVEAINNLNLIQQHSFVPVSIEERRRLASAFMDLLETSNGSILTAGTGESERPEQNVSLRHMLDMYRDELTSTTALVINTLPRSNPERTELRDRLFSIITPSSGLPEFS